MSFYLFSGITVNVLFVTSLSGTLPSLTMISSGAAGISTRITALFLACTSSRFVTSPPANFTVTGTSAPAVPRLSTVMVTM